MQNEGIIERVTSTDWAAPIVIVPKPDATIRLCGDFKVTINPHMNADQYLIPQVDELLFCLKGGQEFLKLDFSDTYLQIELED